MKAKCVSVTKIKCGILQVQGGKAYPIQFHVPSQTMCGHDPSRYG
jgi:hypothetical protein